MDISFHQEKHGHDLRILLKLNHIKHITIISIYIQKHPVVPHPSADAHDFPILSHDSRPQRPRMATAAIAWGLDLFRDDLFRLHAWAAESQQVPRRRSAPGSLESYGRSQFYSPTWLGNQWLVFNCWVFFGGWDVIDGLSIAISRCCGAGPFLCGYCLGWLAQTPTLKNGQTRCFSMG